MTQLPQTHKKVLALRGEMSRRDQRFRSQPRGKKCCECSASLSHWYYEKDGRLYCKKDYWAKFGELCHGCSEPITTGLIMVSPRPSPATPHPSVSALPSLRTPQSFLPHSRASDFTQPLLLRGPTKPHSRAARRCTTCVEDPNELNSSPLFSIWPR
ncbi:hypothetical protein SRHO_G00243870 [Serrasalmus rhombeus]